MTYHANLCFSRVFTSRIVIRSFFSSEDFDDFANRYLVRAVDVLGILVAVGLTVSLPILKGSCE